MRINEARELVLPALDAFHAAYAGAGGQLDLATFGEIAAKLVAQTYESHVGGVGSRDAAWRRFVTWLRKHHPGESAKAIMAAIDAVQPYT